MHSVWHLGVAAHGIRIVSLRHAAAKFNKEGAVTQISTRNSRRL